MGNLVKIRYSEFETGWAEEMGNGKYLIANIPLTKGLNVDDLVRCRQNDDGELVVSRSLKRRYHEKTLIPYEREEQFQPLCEKVQAAGAEIEGMFGPHDGKPGCAIVAHERHFDPWQVAREVGIENQAGVEE